MRSMSRLLTTAACVLILTSSCHRACRLPPDQLAPTPPAAVGLNVSWVSFAALRAISPA